MCCRATPVPLKKNKKPEKTLEKVPPLLMVKTKSADFQPTKRDKN